ncbi:dihydropteroate synthase [Pseudomonadota bacterium]
MNRTVLFAAGQTRVMGILNTTPDSFSDGGLWTALEPALRHAVYMAESGADVIDIGGESTRPGAGEVSVQEELDRVIPLVEAVTRETGVPVSVDTSKPEVMEAAVKSGAGMINDVFALRRAGALETAAKLSVPVCIMHMQGRPRDMQQEPRYDDVVSEVLQFLLARAGDCEQAGIPSRNIVIDPGIGFGKSHQHNIDLFRAIPRFCATDYSVLIGVSRKSLLGKLTSRPVADRVAASIASAVLAAQAGAAMVRVHDVAETVDALKVAKELATLSFETGQVYSR